MVGILLITHGGLGAALLECAAHVVGNRPAQVGTLAVQPDDDPAKVLERAEAALTELDQGDGVLVMSDMFGATPCNIARRLLRPGGVEALAGVNLPMLVRALTYRREPLAQVAEKALSGCIMGVIRMDREGC